MNSESWKQELRRAYIAQTGVKKSNIDLPGTDSISFGGDQGCLTITMTPKAVCANMQANSAAFEAWCLALRVWCGVTQARLNWTGPGSDATKSEQCHYQRFLYRARRFQELFPEWFHLDNSTESCEALQGGTLLLNVEAKPRGGEDEPKPTGDEAILERKLLESESFRSAYGLAGKSLSRQFPVGLFRDTIRASNRIFTGGKSAIDLVGIRDRTLIIFEIKAGKNVNAGIFSELFFYTSLLRDSIPGSDGSAAFSFAATKGHKSEVSPEAVRNCDRIEAVMLGERLHPLVQAPIVLDALNRAAQNVWNQGTNHVCTVRFSAAIVENGDSIQIKRVRNKWLEPAQS